MIKTRTRQKKSVHVQVLIFRLCVVVDDETQALSHWVHLPLSFLLHLSPLFLLWGTQKSFAVNNS